MIITRRDNEFRILLPNDNYIRKLIVFDTHEEVKHAGAALLI